MLDTNTVISISKKRDEPDWLLQMRLDAFARWQKLSEPHIDTINYEPIDYNSLNYFSEHKAIDNSDLEHIYDKMNLPDIEKRALMGMAVDTVIDSTSVNTTYSKQLNELGIIFLPMSEAVKQHPDMVRKYLGSVVSGSDNFYAALNMAVFSDGTFIYIPRGVKCPIELASYFRIETAKIGQFERTLIIADESSELSYLEGCSAPRRPNHQLHSGVVEVIVKDKALVKYSTVQNWFGGDYNDGKQTGGILNFVTKRGTVGAGGKLLWTQIEVGSAITWKYPSSILLGDNSFSDFYSLSITRGGQQADTGTKMIHLGNESKSNVVSYGIALDESVQTFRSKVSFVGKNCANASKCDSRMIGNNATMNTYPVVIHNNGTNNQSHEATTGAIDANALHYLEQSGIETDVAIALIVGGIATPVLQRLPMEFLVESKQLINMAISN